MALLMVASKLTLSSSKQKKHLPGQLNLQDPLDATTFACLTTCFYAAGHVGEFTVMWLNANLRQEKDDNGLYVTVLHLPFTKASSEGEDVSWAWQNGPTDPYEDLENHMWVNQPPLDAQAAQDTGEDPLQGHGIWIGSTLKYLLHGISMETMKVIRQWAGDAFTLYL
ncbi:hypothetical protein L208DRAFT_1426004 [Tricholoma matsutake]|nr:hypothetical protein L208DRAFT_1426004 [Tricholoma matsutake 945]